MGYTEARVVCMERSPDDSGFVPCSLSAKAADGQSFHLSLECAAIHVKNRGCRQPPPRKEP